MKQIIYVLMLLAITSCERLPYLSQSNTETKQEDTLQVPATLKKGQQFDIQFTVSKQLKQTITDALLQKHVYSHLKDKNIDIINSHVTCLILLEAKKTVLFSKEFTFDTKNIDSVNVIKLPVNIWGKQTTSLKPGEKLQAKISFKYFYQTSDEKMREQLFANKVTIHYLSKGDLKEEQEQLQATSWMQKLKLLKELDPFSLRFGFIAGAACIILLLFAAKLFNAIHRGKTSPGVYLPGTQSTFITTRAIFDLVQIELAPFTNVRVLSRALHKLKEGHVIKLDIAYDLSQSDFPLVEKQLKDHLLSILKSKLGLETIHDIRINVKKGTLD